MWMEKQRKLIFNWSNVKILLAHSAIQSIHSQSAPSTHSLTHTAHIQDIVGLCRFRLSFFVCELNAVLLTAHLFNCRPMRCSCLCSFRFKLYILSYSNGEIKNCCRCSATNQTCFSHVCICVLHAQCSCSTGLVFIYNIHMRCNEHTKTRPYNGRLHYSLLHRTRERERRESSRHITFILSHKIPKIL